METISGIVRNLRSSKRMLWEKGPLYVYTFDIITAHGITPAEFRLHRQWLANSEFTFAHEGDTAIP
ncbi:MAG: hypothetical protein U0Y10_01420 [Spirosomataceae bacterium]